MSAVKIQQATCSIPRVGAQARRRSSREELRKSHPEIAAEVESAPWAIDPEKEGDDTWAILDYSYIMDDQTSENDGMDMQCHQFIKVRETGMLKPFIYGSIFEVSPDDDPLTQYVFNVQARYVHAMLMGRGDVSRDCTLINAGNQPEKTRRKRVKDTVLTWDEFSAAIGSAMTAGAR